MLLAARTTAIPASATRMDAVAGLLARTPLREAIADRDLCVALRGARADARRRCIAG